ncbi:hypothetical protein LX32DRAFT_638888 [Colletotrichum zoysiae]|uniref:Uncharacterized protein n=1 Tax=Colletotrichum zoysiae TaxID=1216348 RepID=A0AAD9M0P5_9PEZI|nr:hypothetical protein LX32DRAFT_638888 [Colletotrichum zoysiae]
MQLLGTLVTLCVSFQVASAQQPCLPQNPVPCSSKDECVNKGFVDCASAKVCYFNC